MALRIHFVVGKGEATAREGRSLAASLAQRVAFRAAEGTFNKVKEAVASSFQQDAKRELTHLVSLYRRHIIGASAKSSMPSGMLGYALSPSDTGIGEDDRAVAISESLPGWAPRSPSYLLEKKRKGWPQQWFRARGDLSRALSPAVLLDAYGPIRVSVIRDRELTEQAQRGGFLGARLKTPLDNDGTHIRLNVATIRIYAMETITPSMLPALANGDPAAMNSDDPARGARFLSRLRGVAPEVAERLGRLSYDTHRYRPTLEPFLAWYLTRSIPNALALRLEQGSLHQQQRLNVVRR